LRVNTAALIIRGSGVYATIEATGCADKCTVDIHLWADTPERADAIEEMLSAEFRAHRITDIAFSLNWRFLDGRGSVKSAQTEECASDVLLDEAYPALGSVAEFVEAYLTAPESVLVLQGAPGTGKTRLIRTLLAEISRRDGETASVLYTGDCDVLDTDEVFVEFITSEHAAFVVEDADHLLTPRSEGNQILHRFLNIADGVAQAHGRKIIFSTNLPNVRDIDEALVRPGRCFAHVHLHELQPLEARRLLERLCEDRPDRLHAAWAYADQANKKAHSVAEIYAAYRRVAPSSPRALLRSVARPRRQNMFGFTSEYVGLLR
jgi:hypothetical protein